MLLLGTALVFGLLGSLHCLGMCAPLLWAVPQNEEKRKLWWRNRLSYNAGRAITYAGLGAIIGLVGESLSFVGLQQKISIGTGVLILIFLLSSRGVIPTNFQFKPIQKLVKKVRSSIGALLQNKSAFGQFKLGLFNGFLPCGLVYMALLASVSMGSILGGSLYMFLFGLGTFPMMLAAAFFGKELKSIKPSLFKKAVPAFTAVIALLLITRGLGLGIPYLSPSTLSEIEMTMCIAP